VTFSDTPTRLREAGPERGAHTREIMMELGYTETEIVALVDAGRVFLAER
jgi:crotonobetainyl-CoA:carnitine CoA-transferase CaiB-like acyl-CoA transferase